MPARIQTHSLQRRLLVLLLALVTVAWSLAAAINSYYSMRSLDELLDRHLEQAAAVLIARQVGDMDETTVSPGAQGGKPERVAFQVWHQDGLAMRSANAPEQPMSAATAGFENRRILGNWWRVYTASFGQEIRIYVGERMAVRDQILYTVVRSALWTLSIALPLLALAGWWSVRTGLAPVRQLGRDIARRQPQALDPIRLKKPLLELEPVVKALNQLFERTGSLLEAERRFTADAAHELRTPIAGIRIQAEVARRAGDAAERLRALEKTLAGCDHAKHVIEQLLTMARLEEASAGQGKTIDLVAVVREAAAPLGGSALARRQTLALEAAAPVTVPGDAALIGLLVRNLLDNAIRYSAEGAQIRATVGAEAGAGFLNIEDSGPGMTEEERARLGERFFRVLGTDKPGSGLGWSIVRRIAQVHGLQIETGVSPDLGGLLVCVRWPDRPAC